jgi:hypothetical protein
MESQYFINKKIVKFQNIKVTTKRWKALVVLPVCAQSIKQEKLSIKSMWLISSILN